MALLIFETKKAEEENKYDFCFSLKKKKIAYIVFCWVIFPISSLMVEWIKLIYFSTLTKKVDLRSIVSNCSVNQNI